MTATTGGLSEAKARKLGYTLSRGSYHGTTDDRADRWYIERTESTIVDRGGSGHFTKRDALEALAAFLGEECER